MPSLSLPRILAGSLALAGLATLGSSCKLDPTQSGPDAAPIIYDATPPPPDAAPDATPICDDIELNVQETGHHPERYDFDNGNAGCLGQCHNGTLGESYTIGGALYDRRTAGGDPISGAYIYVIDADGKVVEMMTAQNGFFWSNEPITPPVRTYASGCPDSIPMEASTTGNCNLGACHGEDNKIYLPLESL